METKKSTNRVIVDLKNLNRGDIFYISLDEDATPYMLIDKGTNDEPYILMENLHTGFGHFYRYSKLYKTL